jgi:hypothetical protein
MASSGSNKKITDVVEVYYKWKNSPRFEKWKRKFDSSKSLKISTEMLFTQDEISESELEWSYDNSPTTAKRKNDFVFPCSFPKRKCLGSMSFDLEDPFMHSSVSFTLDDDLSKFPLQDYPIPSEKIKYQIPDSPTTISFSKGNKGIVNAIRELSIHDEFDDFPGSVEMDWFNTS